jgi:hypothetical protein
MTKEQLLETAAGMPDTFHLDELFRKLIIIEKVEQALTGYQAGNYLTNEEMAEKIREMKMRYRRGAA